MTEIVPAISRGPRFKVSGTGDENVLRFSNFSLQQELSVTSGDRFGWRAYVAGNDNNLSASGPGIAIAGYYSNFKYLPGTIAEWVPSLGMTANGRVYCAYLTNPEVINNYINNSGSVRAGVVQRCANMKSWHISQRNSFTIPSETRRKMFDVNIDAASFNNTDVIERSCQGLFIWGIDGGPVPASGTTGISAGYWRFHDVLRVHGMAVAFT